MDAYSLIAIFAALFVSTAELAGILRTRGKILIPGRLPGRRIVGALLCVGLAAGGTALCFGQEGAVREWPLFVAFVIVLAAFLCVRAGLAEDCLYYNGRAIAYENMEYFMIIREFEGGFTLRLHEFSGKDHVLLFREEQRGMALGLLTAGGIPDWDSFRFPSDG